MASKLALGQVTRTFDSPIARTWALWSSFGAAHLYIAGCEAVELRGFGVGSVRVLTMHGNKIRETLNHVDPTAYSYGYTIAESPGFLATGAYGLVQLQELGKNETQITLRGFADSVTPGAEEPLKQQLTALYNDSIEKARKTLDE
ncbi:hypothetical protein AK830_g1264 [Neonectria ditissima]|uniref:Bet v I/Major latex protein domain-containing protein n=1 Tax=Neonectria ditissima TaxID=78410 RepID=A0A0P7BX72_9HYPO|nr:hypothetical protein AK830_g1264 [Neonectria ditissima]